MSLLNDIQSMFNQSGPRSAGTGGNTGGGIFSGLGGSNPTGSMGSMGSAALGSLVGALLGGKKGGMLNKAVLMGGGAWLGTKLWNKYRDRLLPQNQGGSAPSQISSNDIEAGTLASASARTVPEGTGQVPSGAAENTQTEVTSAHMQARAERVIRALVYAARSDGRIDAQEDDNLKDKIKELNLGSQAESMIRQAMNESVDPERVAEGVSGREEAFQLYLLSRSVINIDNFMERAYLDGLAKALNIPESLRQELEKDLSQMPSE